MRLLPALILLVVLIVLAVLAMSRAAPFSQMAAARGCISQAA
ncbi:MAG: hypothetical protein ACO1QS_04450 [Verrucomicrobiota bacterium]